MGSGAQEKAIKVGDVVVDGPNVFLLVSNNKSGVEQIAYRPLASNGPFLHETYPEKDFPRSRPAELEEATRIAVASLEEVPSAKTIGIRALQQVHKEQSKLSKLEEELNKAIQGEF